jgi:hypothetical protein
MYQHLHTQTCTSIVGYDFTNPISKALAFGWRIPRTVLTRHLVLR